MENIPKIYTAVNAVMKDVGVVGKDKVNKQQGFKFRGIDDVMNALYPAMIKNNVFAVPEVLEMNREERQTKNGSNLLYSICKMRYTFYADDGSNVQAVVIGEGMDSGDKATNKAMAIAFKYACFQVFCIPTEEMFDPDAECHEVKSKNSKKSAKTKIDDDTENQKMIDNASEQKIDTAKIKVIKGLIERKGINENVVLNCYKIQKFEDMTVAQFTNALKRFEKTPDKED